MRFRTGLLAIAVCAAAAIPAVSQTASVIKLRTQAVGDTLPKYDTLQSVTATVYGPSGKLAPSVSVLWTANPLGLVKIVPTLKTNQAVKIVALGQGVVHLTATYYTSSFKAVKDSALLSVTKPRVMSVAAYWGFTKDSLGNVLGYQNLVLPVGMSHCVYGVALDRMGGPITGKVVTLTSSDTTIASISPAAGTACPDTSVDPRFVLSAPSFLYRSATASVVLKHPPNLGYYIDHQMPKAVGDAILRAHGVSP